jgi:hypothetical protein
MNSQMIRVISSPSSSTTGFATLILFMLEILFMLAAAALPAVESELLGVDRLAGRS